MARKRGVTLRGISRLAGFGIETVFIAKYSYPFSFCPLDTLPRMFICKGSSTTLSSSFSCGRWGSSNPIVASVNSVTGFVTGLSVGSAIITYQGGSIGYETTLVIVNPNPSVITGNINICVDSTSNLVDSTSGGIWSSSNTAIATVGSISGILLGTATGSANISYTLSTGCFKTSPVNVHHCPTEVAIINSDSNIQISPNPATAVLTINAKDKISTIAINNLVGQIVYSHEYNAQLIHVDVSNLTPGMYLIRINSTEVRKFVKQ